MKNQLKKSFSLFLAVLMILSCWVWVAPDRASAADSVYYYTLVMKNVNSASVSSEDFRIKYKPNNGTGTETQTSNIFSSHTGSGDAADDEGTYTWKGSCNGFPSALYFYFGDFYWGSTGKVRYENICLYVGSTQAIADAKTYPLVTDQAFEKSGDGASMTISVSSDKYPYFDGVSSALSTSTIDLAKINTNTNSTSTVSLSNFKDNYGVNWTATATPSFSLRVDDGITLGTNASMSGSGNSRTITIKPWFQTLYTGRTSAKLYVDWSVKSKSGTETITVNFPTYSATFDANGGKIGDDESSAKDSIEITGDKMTYGTAIGKAPAFAQKAGFEFKGYYSQKNSDATGLTPSFSGKLFKDDETKIVAADYGQQDSEFKGDTTWYAAWQALPITVTFMTADNQLIGTVEGRYNNTLVATNMYNGLANLNAKVKAACENPAVSFGADNAPVYKDGSSTYTFSHWKIIKGYNDAIVDKDHTAVLQGDVTFQAVYTKADAKKYTVSFEDGAGNILKDANGNAYTKNDYKFRDSVIVPTVEPTKAQDDRYKYEFIGWANDIGANFYAVDENNMDSDGAVISYVSKEAAEFTVREDASYVPVFRMVPREYSITFSYTVDGGATESVVVGGYNWDDSITMPESIKDNYTAGGFRYYIDGWTVGTSFDKKALSSIKVNGDLVLTATYGAGQGAEYTINFFDREGNLINDGSNIYTHNQPVTAPTVGDGEDGEFDIPQTIDTEASLYTFVAFKDKNGNVYKQTATADADYYADYSKKDYADVYFYNYDGTLLYSVEGKENFVGDTIPVYAAIDEEGNAVPPSREEDPIGTYNFTGWADGNGNEVLPGTDKFTGDVYLYAQYETVYKEYTVKFLNDDGTPVSEKKYHYAAEIEIPANPTKAADETFTYEFRAWTPDVNEVCYGDATYTATYRRSYNYYKVTWLKDNKTVLSESNYTFGAKIQPAVMNAPANYPDAETGKTWAFKHWVLCDANGNDILVDGKQQIFTRGMKMGTAHLYFYPVFVQEDNIVTVKFYKENGDYIGEKAVAYGTLIADISDAFEADAYKPSNDDYHFAIDKWVNASTGAAVTNATSDVSLKPTYIEVDHDKVIYELVEAPTCTEPGLANMKCADDACNDIDYNVTLDVIPDNGNPSGQIYVGNNKWTSADSVDYNKVVYVGPATNLIVNAQDAGSHLWDNEILDSRAAADGEKAANRGVGKIEYYISEEVIADTTTITTWNEIYNYEATKAQVLNEVLTSKSLTMQEYIALSTPGNIQKAEIDEMVEAILATYNANATGVVSNLNLTNGKTYVIYIRVSDREMNGISNKCVFSSGTIHYGTAAAEIAVSGEGYGTKFCAEADIRITDDTDGIQVFLDGKKVEAYTNPGTTAANGKFVATFKTAEKGVHTVTVIDKNGNKTSKTFEIKGGHSYRNYTVSATCTTDGSRYDLCTLCGVKANEEVLTKLGHNYITYTEKAATCLVDGYRIYTCDNNCGEKLTITPTSAAEVIAQAKKHIDIEGDEDGEWVALTADDIKHLKSTGVHTYAKVKDEDGNDTAEDAWIIDSVPTCSATGSKHKDCVVCGALGRVTETIAEDKENGHKFYIASVTKPATCTEKGEKTRTCRYCKTVELVEYIDALGHTAGKYEPIKAATCEEAGSEVLLCARCEIRIGEADAEGNYNIENPVEKEIAKLGHAYSISGEIYQGEDGKYYQDYVCGNDSTHTKTEEVAGYQPPVAATVTFDYNGGYYAVSDEETATEKTIEKYVGETISANDLAAAEKDDDATKKYAFSHWATKNADGTYAEVEFPIEVKGDATYYAVYAEKYVNYTVTYYKEDGVTVYKKTGYIHNGEAVTLPDGPAKAETIRESYKFAGWAAYVDTQDENGNPIKKLEVVDGDSVTINGKNINLFATYSSTAKKYAVTYAISSSEILESFLVVAGDPAADCYIEPTKEFGTKYHYEFDGWNKAQQLQCVESNIYTTPNFKAIEHVFTESVVSEAKCGVNAVIRYSCSCGYSYEKEEKGTALEHEWGEGVYDAETGKTVVTCQREGCGITQEDVRSYTVSFYGTGADPIAQKYYVAWGSKLSENDIPENPEKEATAEYSYIFKYWATYDENGDLVEVDPTTVTVKSDISFYAVFDEVELSYNVIFAYSATQQIKSYTVGSTGTVEYDGITPVKAYDNNKHYTFSGWEIDRGNAKLELVDGKYVVSEIKSDVYIRAKFTGEDHTYTQRELNNATCQNGKGVRNECACGKYYDQTGKPLDHHYVEVERVEATASKNGYVIYKCDNIVNGEVCNAEKKEDLIFKDSTVTIRVYALHNGAPESGVKVEIRNDKDSSIVYATTNALGVATFKVDKDGIYTCFVNETEVELEKVGADYEGTYSHTDDVSCTCACHRTNIWGAIFRFFHKIIKMFTGEFKCCKNPDPAYGA